MRQAWRESVRMQLYWAGRALDANDLVLAATHCQIADAILQAAETGCET